MLKNIEALTNHFWFRLGYPLIIAIVCLFAIKLESQPTLATVNLTGLIDQFIKSQTNVSPEQLKLNVKNFGSNLEVILKDVSSDNHIILMPSEAVIAGSPDLTTKIMQRIYGHKLMDQNH